MRDPDKNVRTVEAVYHEAALVAAEEGASTRETRAAASRLARFAQERVAEARRAAVARVPRAVEERKPIRPSLLAMTRDALLARIEELRAGHSRALAFGALHHKLSDSISDDDLRSMIEDAETAIEADQRATSEE